MRRRIMRIAVAAAVVAAAAAAGPVLPAGAAVPCTPLVVLGDPAEPVEEGEDLVFTVTLMAGPGCIPDGSVQYQTEDEYAGSGIDAEPQEDYDRQAGLLQWSASQPGDTRKIIVPTKNDNWAEADEEVTVSLFNPIGVNLEHHRMFGTIDSTPICLTGQPFTITIALPKPAGGPVSVNYSTIDGTARAGEDFVGIRDGRQTIAVGDSRAEISLEILPDRVPEPDEVFDLSITLTSAKGTESDRQTITIRS